MFFEKHNAEYNLKLTVIINILSSRFQIPWQPMQTLALAKERMGQLAKERLAGFGFFQQQLARYRRHWDRPRRSRAAQRVSRRARIKFSHSRVPAPGKPRRLVCEPRPGSSARSGPHEDAGAERRPQPPSPPPATSRRHRSPEPRPRRPHSPLPAARNPQRQRGARSPERTTRSAEPGTHSPQHRARNAQPAAPSPAPPCGLLAPAPLFQDDFESLANFISIRVHRATRRRRRP